MENVYIFNVKTHVIIGYNDDKDKDYKHMRFYLILLSCFLDMLLSCYFIVFVL